MRSLRVLAVCGVALVVLGAPVAAAPPVVLTDGPLSDAVLEPSDVPDSRWEAAAPDVIEPEPHTQTNETSGGWCGGVADGSTAEALTPGGSATTTLSKTPAPQQPLWFIWERLLSFDESDSATAVANAKSFIATIKAVIAECPMGWQTTGGEITNSNTPAVATFPKVGKQRLHVSVTTAGDGVTAQTDVVYVRVSNNVAVVHTRILPPDASLLQKIVKRAVKKLQQVAAAA
jgi:hypothetical protein